MGAGASVAGLPLEARRTLYEELKHKYGRSDLDGLAEEEKRAWLEVFEERNAAEVASSVTVAETIVVEGSVATLQEREEGAALSSSQSPVLATAPEERTVRQAATAAAALTGATGGRKSGWDLSGRENGRVRPQGKETRLSHLAAAERNKDDGGGVCNVAGSGASAEDGHRHSQDCKRGTADLPDWKKVAEQVETPNELCVGDIVKARDKKFDGMWFEGVLVAIHDEATFEVELTEGDEEERSGGVPQVITVGVDDVVRVMPWFCIEVGDMVQCMPEGTTSWIRGTVFNVDLAESMYDVLLESETDDEMGDDAQPGGEKHNNKVGECGGGDGQETKKERIGQHSIHRLPDSRIRKLISGRQAAVKQS